MTTKTTTCALLGVMGFLACTADRPNDPAQLGRGKADMPACQNPLPGGVAPLACAQIPQPTGSDIQDAAAAVRLGKALFWDMEIGSDGGIACGSCHFKAGSDVRVNNVVHPGPNGIFEAGNVTRPGQIFDIVSFNADDRIGAQGMARATFVSAPADTTHEEICTPTPDPLFGMLNQVTPRRAPSVVGAVFNRSQFRDGRAEPKFNGTDPFGDTGNANAPGALFDNASLFSQATGPIVDPVEMACIGRPVSGPGSLASKMLPRTVLRRQWIHPQDSVLGMLAAPYPKQGAVCGDHPCTYQDLVTAAFRPDVAADAQNQFVRIFAEAVATYVSTLIPDQTPLDRYLLGDMAALTAQQQQGLALFTGKARCVKCHAGPELADSSVSFAEANGPTRPAGGDQGFHNTGVRPTDEDLGRATVGPKGIAYSKSGNMLDRGAFKTVQLRNVGLRGPYFHAGVKGSLEDVVDFYSRGGDFANPEKDPELQVLDLSAEEKAALVDFLRNGLTDCRAQKRRAPFDSPYIIPRGWTQIGQTGAEGEGTCP